MGLCKNLNKAEDLPTAILEKVDSRSIERQVQDGGGA
jgi:hypothetical protein